MKVPALTDITNLLSVWARFSLQYEKDIGARTPAVGQVTLTASTTTTTFSHQSLTLSKKLILTPTTANAATAAASLYWDIGTASGSVTLHHASSANVDQTFNYAIVGI